MNARPDTRPMGLIMGMSFEDYHQVEAFSATGMRLLSRSPWHFKNRVPVVPTRPMLNGSLAHCAILEPDAMAQRYIVVPEDAPKRPTEAQWNAKKSNESSQIAKEWWAAFGEEAAGKVIVRAEDYAVTRAQLAAVAADPEIAGYLASGYSEASVFWIDEATGVYCKARPDWVHELDERRVVLMDLKSTQDESPEGFGRTTARMGYHRQSAHYTAGFEKVTGLKVERFVFAAVSSALPVLAVPLLLPEDFAEQGRDEVRELLALYARCQQTDVWPSYGTGCLEMAIPAYANRSNEVEVSYVD